MQLRVETFSSCRELGFLFLLDCLGKLNSTLSSMFLKIRSSAGGKELKKCAQLKTFRSGFKLW